ncbi:response regulator [Sphingomonas aracearum]|uniref:response regulator n=1 Tax=Sphingomonas aracearum TaxID=2283317 RepID=UPI0015EFEC32|nr:response regulator [Sphingomonas aracearum]
MLIVDDEPLQRCFAQRVLAAAGWQAEAVAEGAAAVAALDEPAALVLLDLHMAGMDGAATLAAMRAASRNAAVPVIAFTATRLEDVAPLLARGFDDYLAKPCTAAELLACAERWRPRAQGVEADWLQRVFGRAEIDALLARFRDLLVEGLAATASGEAVGLAHRVAGIAGTLGFTTLGRAWLDHSEGRGERFGLRRDTRLAIGAIDRLLGTGA